jgi:hypothetical protein
MGQKYFDRILTSLTLVKKAGRELFPGAEYNPQRVASALTCAQPFEGYIPKRKKKRKCCNPISKCVSSLTSQPWETGYLIYDYQIIYK